VRACAALARIAPLDQQPLALAVVIEVETGGAGQRDDRIVGRRVNPVRAEVDRHAESDGVRHAAPAGAVPRLQDDDRATRSRQLAGGGNAGRAGADDDDVSLRRQPAGGLCVPFPGRQRTACGKRRSGKDAPPGHQGSVHRPQRIPPIRDA
jgi:hypothetical protein